MALRRMDGLTATSTEMAWSTESTSESSSLRERTMRITAARPMDRFRFILRYLSPTAERPTCKVPGTRGRLPSCTQERRAADLKSWDHDRTPDNLSGWMAYEGFRRAGRTPLAGKPPVAQDAWRKARRDFANYGLLLRGIEAAWEHMRSPSASQQADRSDAD